MPLSRAIVLGAIFSAYLPPSRALALLRSVSASLDAPLQPALLTHRHKRLSCSGCEITYNLRCEGVSDDRRFSPFQRITHCLLPMYGLVEEARRKFEEGYKQICAITYLDADRLTMEPFLRDLTGLPWAGLLDERWGCTKSLTYYAANRTSSDGVGKGYVENFGKGDSSWTRHMLKAYPVDLQQNLGFIHQDVISMAGNTNSTQVVIIQRQGESRMFKEDQLQKLSNFLLMATGLPSTTYYGCESVAETIRTFYKAVGIVGYFGAAWANVLFSARPHCNQQLSTFKSVTGSLKWRHTEEVKNLDTLGDWYLHYFPLSVVLKENNVTEEAFANVPHIEQFLYSIPWAPLPDGDMALLSARMGQCLHDKGLAFPEEPPPTTAAPSCGRGMPGAPPPPPADEDEASAPSKDLASHHWTNAAETPEGTKSMRARSTTTKAEEKARKEAEEAAAKEAEAKAEAEERTTKEAEAEAKAKAEAEEKARDEAEEVAAKQAEATAEAEEKEEAAAKQAEAEAKAEAEEKTRKEADEAAAEEAEAKAKAEEKATTEADEVAAKEAEAKAEAAAKAEAEKKAREEAEDAATGGAETKGTAEAEDEFHDTAPHLTLLPPDANPSDAAAVRDSCSGCDFTVNMRCEGMRGGRHAAFHRIVECLLPMYGMIHLAHQAASQNESAHVCAVTFTRKQDGMDLHPFFESLMARIRWHALIDEEDDCAHTVQYHAGYRTKPLGANEEYLSSFGQDKNMIGAYAIDTALNLRWMHEDVGEYVGTVSPQIVLIQRRDGCRMFHDDQFLQLGNKITKELKLPIAHFYGAENVADTIKLFNAAAGIVGYHGAAFANALFGTHRHCLSQISTLLTLEGQKQWRVNTEIAINEQGKMDIYDIPLKLLLADNNITVPEFQNMTDKDHMIKDLKWVPLRNEDIIALTASLGRCLRDWAMPDGRSMWV